ncbi:DUF2971 domain-containing protein [Teredinibacter turnerae]|uniref:DUF2971 domain-containing protein n=1 Tax=Teredinibacter turnerae TaxID=2426 RepID=UPI00037D3AFE|nr:DUF2971 domain-containing protein [Teredinibacter turnerae]
MRVYYYTAEEFALSNIVNQRIKVSLLDELNDPYEFLGIDVSDPEFRAAMKSGRDLVAKRAGVICFSKSWQNPIMWAHYGNKHRGICLGFDIEDKHLKEVEYLSDLVQPEVNMELKAGGLPPHFFERLLNLKYKGWSYEDELRVHVPLDERHPTGYYFTDFAGNMELKEVILGPRCLVSIEDVKKHLHAYMQSVTVFKSRIAFKNYMVVRNRAEPEYVHKSLTNCST